MKVALPCYPCQLNSLLHEKVPGNGKASESYRFAQIVISNGYVLGQSNVNVFASI